MGLDCNGSRSSARAETNGKVGEYCCQAGDRFQLIQIKACSTGCGIITINGL